LSLPATHSISLGKQPFIANLQILLGKAPVPLENMPEVILDGNRCKNHKVFVLTVFLEVNERSLLLKWEWPAEKQFTDKSADRTNKSIKQKPMEIRPFTKHFFIAPIKNVLFLFHLHSLVCT
jgi:hypothetical protein